LSLRIDRWSLTAREAGRYQGDQGKEKKCEGEARTFHDYSSKGPKEASLSSL
jgi:hypothetical protein